MSIERSCIASSDISRLLRSYLWDSASCQTCMDQVTGVHHVPRRLGDDGEMFTNPHIVATDVTEVEYHMFPLGTQH